MREWLKNLREQKKLRQKDVAKMLDVTEQYYNYIENGKRQTKMDIGIAAKIADFFDIPLSKIRYFEESLAAGKDTA